MRYSKLFLVPLLLLCGGCRTDYDIEDVASEEHLCSIDHDHEAEDHQQDLVHDDSLNMETAGISGSDRHVHSEGERNHGTEWFFNQPWAAEFVWGKMLRDSLILLLAAAAVFLLSGYRRKRR